MKRLANPSQNQLIALGILVFSAGATFNPPLQVLAQPPQSTFGESAEQIAGTPQPLATPVAADSASSRSTRTIGTITGQGTVGNIPKFTGTNAIGNSVLFENAGKVGIGTTTPLGLLSVKGTATNVYPIYGLGVGNAILGSSAGGIGVYGVHSNTSGDQSGVSGETSSTSANATGVLGTVLSTTPGVSSAGVRGVNRSTNAHGIGVYGSQAGFGSGVYGTSPNGTGVQGIVSSTNPGIFSAGVRGINNTTSGSGYGVYGSSPGGTGVYGSSTSSFGMYGDSANGIGVGGSSSVSYGLQGTSTDSYGVFGSSENSHGIHGTSNHGYGVHGYSYSYGGVGGESVGGTGVTGVSSGGFGMRAISTSNRGISGESTNGPGVFGQGNIGVQGNANGTSNSYAGNFNGPVYVKGSLTVTGTVSKGAGSFKIDHPLHPATEYLSHSFVESPDMMNIYNGNVTTDARGHAWVKLPSYFSALNRDFRYQLTPIGQFAQAIVGQEIQGTRFQIKTDKPHVKVSWMVTGIRNDAYARQHRIQVEESKTGADQGKYLYPAGFGAGQEKQIGAQSYRLAQYRGNATG